MRGIAIGLCNAITICAGIIFQPFMGMLWPYFGPKSMLLFPALLIFSCLAGFGLKKSTSASS
jgi:nitrate/nitrite transporter NarK